MFGHNNTDLDGTNNDHGNNDVDEKDDVDVNIIDEDENIINNEDIQDNVESDNLDNDLDEENDEECAVLDCDYSEKPLFPFPTDVNRVMAWFDAHKKWKTGTLTNKKICFYIVCHLHFVCLSANNDRLR